jgi:hypothetical protein
MLVLSGGRLVGNKASLRKRLQAVIALPRKQTAPTE